MPEWRVYGDWIQMSDLEQFNIATELDKQVEHMGGLNDAWALEVDQLKAQLATARGLLREACDAWDEAMPPMMNQSTRYPALPICWREAARAAGGGE